MKANNRHIDPDYNVLLRKYVAGSISKAERFALEKRALDDPFVAEALEGLRLEKEADLSAAVDRINKGILVQKVETKRPVFWTRRLVVSIAASLLLISVIGYQLMDSGKANQEMLASTPEYETTTSSEDIPEIAEVLKSESEKIEGDREFNNDGLADYKEEEADNKLEEVNAKKRVQEENSNLDLDVKPADTGTIQNENVPAPNSTSRATKAKAKNASTRTESLPPVAEDQMIEKAEAGAANDDQLVFESDAASSKLDVEAEAMDGDLMKDKKSVALIKITGQIIDADQTPLIGASIVMLDSQVGVVSDVDGNFTIEVSDLPVELVVSYTGFGNEYRMILDSTQQTIVMQEHAQLDEVVITNAGNIVLDDVSQSTGHPHRAKPKSGFFVLEEFIKDNRYQSMEDKNSMSGYVLVGFTITTDGETKNLRIISSNCRACHDRAKWLIENSGLWHNESAADIQATYQISF